MDFTTPIPGHFHYLGWDTHPRYLGPKPVDNAHRRALKHRLAALARDLETQPAVGRARALETVFVPPAPGAPRYDLILLIDTTSDPQPVLGELLPAHHLPQPDVTWTATNVARFGATDDTDGPILLNHFRGDTDPATATATWRGISAWYEHTLHVDNSTLLEFSPDNPWLIMNYATIPTSVPVFLLNQLRRPSFYTHVTRPLQQHHMRPYPLFATRIQAKPTQPPARDLDAPCSMPDRGAGQNSRS